MADKPTVDTWVAAKAGSQADAIAAVRTLLAEVGPELDAAIKWGQPVYSHNGPAIYFKPAKAHLTFGFWRGVELDDPAGLLAGTGAMMRHVKLTAAADVQDRREALAAFIRQAIALNAAKGDPTRAANR